jgi:hypothetical protein
MGTHYCLKRKVEEKKNDEIIKDLIKSKLNEKDINFLYLFEKVKICLIKGEQVPGFFNNRNLFKYNYGYNYNSFTVSNYLKKRNIVLIIMQYFEDNKFDLFNYKIEEITLVETKTEKMMEYIIFDINCKHLKNYVFAGIVNNSKKYLRNYKLIYKKNTSLNNEIQYSVLTHKGKLDDETLRLIVSEEIGKNKILKAILTDKYSEKAYYLIFEELLNSDKQFDYVVISMNKNNENDFYLIDIAMKISQFQLHNYFLSCFYSDKDKTMFVLYREVLVSL